jgi:hypothetical protein
MPPTRLEGSLATYVLIHGAGVVGWYWHLSSASFERVATGWWSWTCRVDDDAATLSDYADVVVEAIGDLCEDLVVRRRLA